jgi:hypothetical protein
MRKIIVPKDVQIVVCTDLHAHPEQFFKLIDRVQPCEKTWLVSLSDYFDKGFGDEASFLIIDKMIEMSYLGYGYSVLGNHDIKFIKKNKKNTNHDNRLTWLRTLPLSLTFEFYNGTLLTCVHAGVTNKMTWEDLQTNTEVLYVRDVDEDEKMIPLIWANIDGVKTLIPAKSGGKAWHLSYDGRLGYIASGHAANKDGLAKYYNYSCNLDSAVFETGILTGQYFTPEGKLGEQITVTGTAFKPKLNIQK